MKVAVLIIPFLLHLLTWNVEERIAQSRVPPSICQNVGFDNPNVTYIDHTCRILCNMLYIGIGSCPDQFGDAFVFTDKGQFYITNGISPQTAAFFCDYYEKNKTVAECFYKNGTLNIANCGLIFSMAILNEFNCTGYYTIDRSKYPPLAELGENFLKNPCVYCNPIIGIPPCQKDSSTCPPPPCPNCEECEK